MTNAWLIAGIVVVFVGAVATWRSSTAQRWYLRAERIRKPVSLVVGGLIAIVFLASGDPFKTLIGILILAVGSLYAFIERPWERL